MNGSHRLPGLPAGGQHPLSSGRLGAVQPVIGAAAELDAVHVRHVEVHDYQGGRGLTQKCPNVLGIGDTGEHDSHRGEDRPQDGQDRWIVVGHQNPPTVPLGGFEACDDGPRALCGRAGTRQKYRTPALTASILVAPRRARFSPGRVTSFREDPAGMLHIHANVERRTNGPVATTGRVDALMGPRISPPVPAPDSWAADVLDRPGTLSRRWRFWASSSTNHIGHLARHLQQRLDALLHLRVLNFAEQAQDGQATVVVLGLGQTFRRHVHQSASGL